MTSILTSLRPILRRRGKMGGVTVVVGDEDNGAAKDEDSRKEN